MDSGPAVKGDGGEEDERDHHIRRSRVFVCEERGDEAANNADAVHNYEKVNGISVGDADDASGVLADVIIGRVDAPEAEEDANGEESVLGFFEGGEFDDGAYFTGRYAGAGQGEGDELEGEHYEADYADGPAEANAGKGGFNDAGEEHTACRGTGGGDANGDGAILGEVGGDEGEGRAEEETGADAGADALGEEQLPVFCGQRGHEDA